MTGSAFDRFKWRFRGSFRGVKTALVLTLLAAGLAGCSAYEYISDKISDPIVLRCPDYLVIAEAANLVRFLDGPGRDLIDIDFETEITRVQLACTSYIDRRTRAGTLEVDVTVTFLAQRGPANRSREGRFDYFISVVGRDQKILYREAFAINVGFPGNKTRVLLRSEPVTLEIPITPKQGSRSFLIFAGLKLSRGELEFNRRRREKTGK